MLHEFSQANKTKGSTFVHFVIRLCFPIPRFSIFGCEPFCFLCMCILYKVFFLIFVFPIQPGLDCMLRFEYRFMFFWWCMSIREYVFVLFLSFCRTTIQKVRPLDMSTRFVVFGLRFCLGWFGMFGFFTSLSFPKPRFVVFWCMPWSQKVRPLLMLHVHF